MMLKDKTHTGKRSNYNINSFCDSCRPFKTVWIILASSASVGYTILYRCLHYCDCTMINDDTDESDSEISILLKFV